MRLDEVIDDYNKYFDFEKVSSKTYKQIMDVLARQDTIKLTAEEIELMYGQVVGRDSLERHKLSAEIDKLKAVARRDRAAEIDSLSREVAGAR